MRRPLQPGTKPWFLPCKKLAFCPARIWFPCEVDSPWSENINQVGYLFPENKGERQCGDSKSSQELPVPGCAHDRHTEPAEDWLPTSSTSQHLPLGHLRGPTRDLGATDPRVARRLVSRGDTPLLRGFAGTLESTMPPYPEPANATRHHLCCQRCNPKFMTYYFLLA